MSSDSHYNNFFPPQIQERALKMMKSRIGFAYVSPKLVLRTSSPLLERLAQTPQQSLVDQKLPDAFIEFYGAEPELKQILKGEIPFLEIKDVNRENESTHVLEYYNFVVYPADESKTNLGLLLVVEETSDAGTLKQSIIQQRNELKLMQSRLAQANAELHQLNHLKSLFLSMAAHDLRTPLSIITGYADMLQEGLDESIKPQDLSKLILEQSMWLSTLIDGILDLQLIENDSLPFSPIPINLTDTMGEIVASYQPILASRDIALITSFPETPVIIHADPTRIKQVAFNLIGNSAKFIGEAGEIRVTIELRPGQNVVVLTFADNGPGIDIENQEQIFELFYQTKQGMQAKGSGIGLFIVKSIVEAHQGTITVDSQRGEGATFTIALPSG